MERFACHFALLALVVALGVSGAPAAAPAAGRSAPEPGRLAALANWIHRLHVSRANHQAARRTGVEIVGLPATTSTAKWWVWSTPIERDDPSGAAVGLLTYWDLGDAPCSRTLERGFYTFEFNRERTRVSVRDLEGRPLLSLPMSEEPIDVPLPQKPRTEVLAFPDAVALHGWRDCGKDKEFHCFTFTSVSATEPLCGGEPMERADWR